GRLNDRQVPENAALASAVLVSLILFAVRFVTNALDFTLDLTASLALAPYAFASAYAVKIAWQGDGHPHAASGQRRRELAVALLSTAYTLFLIWAAGYRLL